MNALPKSADVKMAVQTGRSRGGVAVVALWGDGVADILSKIFRPVNTRRKLPAVGDIMLGDLCADADAANMVTYSSAEKVPQSRLDEILLARASENVFEINLHGGQQVLRSVLDLLTSLGASYADKQAAAQLQLWNPSYPQLDNPAIGREMLALLEDVESQKATELISWQWHSGISALAAEILDCLQSGGDTGDIKYLDSWAERCLLAAGRLSASRRLLQVPTVVFAGAPNAGKSSLVNALAQKVVGVVCDIPGTTRDWLSQHVEISSVALNLIDTAGLFDSDSEIDSESVKRSWQLIENADLVCVVIDSAAELAAGDRHYRRLISLDNTLIIANKLDLCRNAAADIAFGYDVSVSATTGAGLAELTKNMLIRLGLDEINPKSESAFTARQGDCLTKAANFLQSHSFDACISQLRQLLGRS